MTDFLTRLVKRTQGDMPVVRPVVAPLFAEGASLAGEQDLPERAEVISAEVRGTPETPPIPPNVQPPPSIPQAGDAGGRSLPVESLIDAPPDAVLVPPDEQGNEPLLPASEPHTQRPAQEMPGQITGDSTPQPPLSGPEPGAVETQETAPPASSEPEQFVFHREDEVFDPVEPAAPALQQNEGKWPSEDVMEPSARDVRSGPSTPVGRAAASDDESFAMSSATENLSIWEEPPLVGAEERNQVEQPHTIPGWQPPTRESGFDGDGDGIMDEADDRPLVGRHDAGLLSARPVPGATEEFAQPAGRTPEGDVSAHQQVTASRSIMPVDDPFEPKPPEPPAIRISIGRVTVKGVSPPEPPAPLPAPTRPKPALSLDEYLARRERNERR